ncbi:hypothetical protein BUALT_Bualt19G0081700 [Buddleja alternifolia]|uniref:Uncharacterized protein n=1 Tax=Buddleja alternifolia TaxID=168488 RepID=A0AAV6W8H6_9LAMI|nr:hypothetical protein BUALT_Bualt19G0081700 [Buddleja alternifolia]
MKITGGGGEVEDRAFEGFVAPQYRFPLHPTTYERDDRWFSPISVEYLLFIAGAEMSSFEIVDSGKFSGGRSNFSQTCNLLRQYLKENGSFGDLTLGLTTPKVEPKEIVAGDVEIEGDRSSVSDLGDS